MDFTYSDEQVMLREGARRFLAEKCSLARVREIVETDSGYDAELWRALCEQGWTAMAIPEEYGGAGFTYSETAILIHEMGRVLAPVPFLSSVLAAEAVLAGGTDEQKAEWLPALASGDVIGTLAVAEPSGDWSEASVAAMATPEGDGYSITGTKSFVTAGHVADVLIVAARIDDSVGLFVVAADQASSTKLVTLDTTRTQATVELVDASAVRLGNSGWDVVERVFQVAAIALAAEQVGGLERTLEMAVEYAKERKQFGRAIGSFQAVKHLCADMLVSLESARSAAGYAVWALATNSDEVAMAAPLAKSYCSEAYFKATGDNIQIHGGIGFTWEHDAHLYFKRAKSTELLFGSPAQQRRELADQIGL